MASVADTAPSPVASSSRHPLRPYARDGGRGHDWLSEMAEDEVRNGGSLPADMAFALRSTPSRLPRSRFEYPGSAELGELDSMPTVEPGELLRKYLNAGFLGFASTALVMPFEVGKTLLQVQWVPKEDVDERWAEARRKAELGQRSSDEDDEDRDDLSDDADVDEYFTEMTSRSHSQAGRHPSLAPLGEQRRRRPHDASGYLVRRSVFDETTKPEYTLPVIVQGGTMEMIKAIFRWRGEGGWSLWKGQLTTFILDTLSSTLQPILLTTLSFVFSPSSPSNLMLPLEHHAHPGLPLAISVGSFLLTGLILSPLDLIRTRLIVQSSQPRHRKYAGPVDGLRKVMSEEGGWTTTYFHANLFFPALLDNLCRPLIHLSTPLIIDRRLRIDRLAQPVLYGVCDLVLSTAGLLVILPIETVRKRLQLQPRYSAVSGAGTSDPAAPVGEGRAGKFKPFRPCVETRPAPYAGIVDAVYRIITEESGRPPHPSRQRGRRQKSMDSSEIREVRGGTAGGSGLLQLYRGFNVGLTANLVVFLLGLVGRPGEGVGGGWAEM